MLHRNQQPNTGFTLVETLVAISILLLVVVGQMTVAQKGIRNSFYANEQMTAVFLAQEAIEAVRQYRDDTALNVLDGVGSTSDWIGDITDICDGSGCAYDNIDNRFETCSSNNSCNIYVADGRYSHRSSGAIQTPFTRRVTIEEESDEAVSVSVEVSWESGLFGGDQREVILQTWVYDHYRRFGGF